MRALRWIRPGAGLALATCLLAPGPGLLGGGLPSARAYTLNGGALALDQRTVLVFDNFSDPEANDNAVPDADWPGYTGAELALWKAASEWGSELHALNGSGDPHQVGDLGSGGANFDASWQGNNSIVGSTNDNTHSELSGSAGSTLAFTETPVGDGWRIRYYSDPWIWSDGPDTAGTGSNLADLQGIGTHQYGHALGLGHSLDPSATMFASAAGPGFELRSIEADDVAGVQFIYGALDLGLKPHIDLVTTSAGIVTVIGERFDPTDNELWFTKAAVGPGGPVKVTGLTSDGTSITAAVPPGAGPGDVLVKRGGVSGHAGLSNQMPFTPGSAVRHATALNIDIGVQMGVPGPGQGHAAGAPGVWNGIQPSNGLTPLVDLYGMPVSATITTTGVNGEYSFNNSTTFGGAEKLLDDLEDLGCSPGGTSTWTVAGMSAGQYEVFVYSWGPDNPTGYSTQVTVEGGAAGPQTCGGAAWAGGHVEGGTFVRDVVPVFADGGSIRVTVTTLVGCGSVNGFQIQPAMGCGPVTAYCTAGTSAAGCVPMLGGNGTPSASAQSGFTLVAAQVEGNKDGLFFWGINGRQANPWGNGTSYQCVVPPVWRGGLLKGSGTAGSCDGTFSQDLNALWCSACPKPAKNPGPGTVTQAQLWYRDPQSTSNQTTSLSGAVEFVVCP